jgi:hypothetical protein
LGRLGGEGEEGDRQDHGFVPCHLKLIPAESGRALRDNPP